MQKALVSLKIDTKPSETCRDIDNALKDECQLVEQRIAYGFKCSERSCSQIGTQSDTNLHLFLTGAVERMGKIAKTKRKMYGRR